jgi:sialate O-acetylesterase
MRQKLILTQVFMCLVTTLRAEVRLPGYYSDNMVLQQGEEVPIWGWADAGEVVTVRFHGQEAKATPVIGKWMVRMK